MVIISLHNHNDRGTGVACAELGLLAGASRIFEMMDEMPELDEGYVTLVNVKNKSGKLIETKEKTNPHPRIACDGDYACDTWWANRRPGSAARFCCE